MLSKFSSQLPTPPHSPHQHVPSDAMASSLDLLNSLTTFYQQERYWTHHTRAALESVLSNSFRGRVEASIGADESQSSREGSFEDGKLQIETIVKREPSSPKLGPIDGQRRRATKWNRRKNNLKLKLGGIEPPIRKQETKPSQHILEMFAQLVESRMESCERVTKLVKHANRADLYRL